MAAALFRAELARLDIPNVQSYDTNHIHQWALFIGEAMRALKSLRDQIEAVLDRDPSLDPSPEIRAGERLVLADTNRKIAILTGHFDADHDPMRMFVAVDQHPGVEEADARNMISKTERVIVWPPGQWQANTIHRLEVLGYAGFICGPGDNWWPMDADQNKVAGPFTTTEEFDTWLTEQERRA
jgi:hypothetical protein